MDKFEEHIRRNRENLDIYSPSSGVWKNIKNELRKGKSVSRRLIMIAAMFVVILGTAVVFFRSGTMQFLKNGESENASGQASVNPQLKETEIYYNNLVNSLYREATPLLTGNPEIRKELNTDISQLDSICSEIRKDLKDNIANQEVVEALILNYRLKIRLLEDMLIILKENDNTPEKNKSHEI
jgi:CHASE3 domain sensor protein